MENPAADNTQRMRAGFHAPAPHRTRQNVVAGNRRQRTHRVGRVQIDRRAQCRRTFPERIIGTVVEIFAVGVPVDHRAAKLQLAYTALEFVGSGFRILHCKMSEAGIAVWTLLHFLGKEIVRCARGARGCGGITLSLHARSGDRQYRPRDTSPVHHLQSLFAEIGQARIELRRLGRRDISHRRAPIGFGSGIQEVLFERDFLDHTSPSVGQRLMGTRSPNFSFGCIGFWAIVSHDARRQKIAMFGWEAS